MRFFQAILNAFRIPDLRKRILFTLATLAVFRLGRHIPLPGINLARWEEFLHRGPDGLFGMFDLFSGGNLQRLSVFALGVNPYITASILLQVFTISFASLQRLQREGEMGRRKISQWTRYLAAGLALAQSLAAVHWLEGMGVVAHPGAGFLLTAALTLTTGTLFLMWLGERITERGIGNGVSLLIFSGIVTSLPEAVAGLYHRVFVTREWGPARLSVLLAAMLAAVAFVVLVERAERRVTVQYSRRTLGQETHLPLKLNAGGVVPVIFASAAMSAPQAAASLDWVRAAPWASRVLAAIRHGEPAYYLVFAALVIAFGFLYVSIIFNPREVADSMRKFGGFLPGLRPGAPTATHLDRILSRLTVLGGLYLAILCLIPDLLISGIRLQHLPLVGDWCDNHLPRFLLDGLGLSFGFGGTSLLIVVGVAMDLVNQVEAQLVMRYYETFRPRRRRLAG